MKEAAGQGNRNQPREKIRGSQHVRREEKIRPKLTIRNPFLEWNKGKKRTPPR
jgi:hypothetical protein